MAVAITDKISYKRIVTAGNDDIFFEDVDVAAGTMVELDTSSGAIDTGDQLTMASAFQKAFIANGANLKIGDFINVKLTHAALATPHARGDILTQDTTHKMIVDFTNTAKTATYGYVTAGTWECTNAVTGSGSGTGFTPTGINGRLTHAALTTAHTAGDELTQAVTGATMTVEVTDTAKTHTWGQITAGTFNTTNEVDSDGAGDDGVIPTAVNTKPPLYYDWTVYQGDTTTYGTMPDKAYLVCVYRGRLVLAGNPEYPHQWYMSRVANPFDFLYGSGDPMSAVAGNNADAGQCADIIRCLISFHDDYLIFGCASTVWLLRGDPVAGGSLDNLSDTTGIYGASSWCFDDDRNLYFWGTGGIYKIEANFSGITNLTETLLPDLIDDEAADPSTHRITMGYDKKRHGLIISITVIATGVNSDYFYSFKTNGFFPETYPEECGPYSMLYYDANATGYADLLIGCKDGYIRKFLNTAKDDDIGGTDEAISSYVVYPITPMAEEDVEGKLTEMVFDLAGGAADGAFSDTDGVSYSLYNGNDAETVLEDIIDGADAFASGTLSGTGRKNKIRPRMRGAYMGLKLSNSTADETWSINKVKFGTRKAGRL